MIGESPARDPDDAPESLDIAVVGMSARFPGAVDIDRFWENLCSGVCSVTRLTREQIAERDGAASMASHPDYVPAAYPLEQASDFDADFFGYAPREAEVMDPQHRAILECAWSALEDAAIDPQRSPGAIGVFAGAGQNTYLHENVRPHREITDVMGEKQILVANRPDFLSSRISYKLGLCGPSMTIQTACSTSLVATVQAMQSLLAYECDVALTGGVAIDPTRWDGYLYRPDGILSPDGVTRTLDAKAKGTVGADGVGVAVLKRLSDAVRDGDTVHAVLKGGAVNNDGGNRAGFSAPNPGAQSEVIARAMSNADVEPASIGYIELHGTGTVLGDPIEFAALRRAFSGVGDQTCSVGSVKANVGHTDAAAGICGLIKAVLMVKHGEIPPLPHFESANPRLRLDESPFRVPTTLEQWPEGEGPRRVGVNSFGLGGTNAHVIVEQPPAAVSDVRSTAASGAELLVLSARTPDALITLAHRLAEHLRLHPDTDLHDVAVSLRDGRQRMRCRTTIVAESVEVAIAQLEDVDGSSIRTSSDSPPTRICFLLDGFGSQRSGMAADLYRDEPVFAAAIDECASVASSHGVDVLQALLHTEEPSPVGSGGERSTRAAECSSMDVPSIGYPAVFAFDYALAQLWAEWNVVPDMMIGHSLGEYVAACLAGVLTVPDAIGVLIERGRLIEETGEGVGAMLALSISAKAATQDLPQGVSVAVVNDSVSCVVSGPTEAVAELESRLDERGVATQRLSSRYAFHSALMDPLMDPVRRLIKAIPLRTPSIPFVSNMTGTWMSGDEATDPGYWAQQLRSPVLFDAGIAEVWRSGDVAVVEVGYGQALASAALQSRDAPRADRIVVPSLPTFGTGAPKSMREFMLRAAGRLWEAGVGDPRPPAGTARRMSLPTYPFERRRYWLDAGVDQLTSPPLQSGTQRSTAGEWFSVPSWTRKEQLEERPTPPAGETWLVFVDRGGFGDAVCSALRRRGERVVRVSVGREFRSVDDSFGVRPDEGKDFEHLAQALRDTGSFPDRVLNCWAADEGNELATHESMILWAQASAAELSTFPSRWDVVTRGAMSVTGAETLRPNAASLRGLVKVLRQEFPLADSVLTDLDCGAEPADAARDVLGVLTREVVDREIAFRGRFRWIPGFHDAELETTRPLLREGGVFLITGGLGRIGMIAAERMARTVPCTLVLITRRGFPDRSRWDDEHEAPVRLLIERIRGVEAMGSRVRVVTCDVADGDAVLAAIEGIRSELGPVNGVVHAAGITGAAAHASILEETREGSRAVFAPKVAGTLALHAALSGTELDFAYLFSSVATILGGLSFASYAGANAVMDAVAASLHRPSQPWCAVDWEAWRSAVSEPESGVVGTSLEDLALSDEEGSAVIARLFEIRPPSQLVVSTARIADRAALWERPGSSPTNERPLYDRPTLRNSFMVPVSDDERLVASVWGRILGVRDVGLLDNFFELGGNSLLGLQVLQELRTAYRLPLPLRAVYEAPNVRTMARFIQDTREGQ